MLNTVYCIHGEMSDTRSNKALCFREFRKENLEGTPEGK